MGCLAHKLDPTYCRHEPEQTALYQAVAGHLETFLAECRCEGHALPSHVEGELRRFLDCGVYARGFSRWVCEECGSEKVVASSCKGRGFCPSCIGRRMNETAALLVDYVLPAVPVRQWVLSLPIELRYRLAYDGKLCTEVLGIFLRTVARWYRRQANDMGYPGGKTGSVTVVQRASSDLRLNPHFHVLQLDGVYVEQDGEQAPLFVETPSPTDDDIKSITENVAERVIRLLVRRGVLDETSTEVDPLTDQEPVLAGLLQASVLGTSAVGDRAGQRIRRVLSDPASGQRTGRLCFASRGFSLHAARREKAEHRERLEELVRYVLRPPLANNRLKWLSDDELLLTLKRAWSDGTKHLLVTPMELIGRLASLVPPKGFNGIRYHGVLAPRSKLRSLVIPKPPTTTEPAITEASVLSLPEPSSSQRPKRIPWAQLLLRVFRVDVEKCACGGRLKLVAFITDPIEARRYLDFEGLPSAWPTIAPARAPPQFEMEFGES